MPRYDYVCECGTTTESVQGMDVTFIPCPKCGAPARRSPLNLPYLHTETGVRMGPSDRRANIKDKHDRTRLSVFQEATQEIDYLHKKDENDAGRELPHPNLYKRALQRARVENAPMKGER